MGRNHFSPARPLACRLDRRHYGVPLVGWWEGGGRCLVRPGQSWVMPGLYVDLPSTHRQQVPHGCPARRSAHRSQSLSPTGPEASAPGGSFLGCGDQSHPSCPGLSWSPLPFQSLGVFNSPSSVLSNPRCWRRRVPFIFPLVLGLVLAVA